MKSELGGGFSGGGRPIYHSGVAIYLDYAGSAPMRRSAIERYGEVAQDLVGNPSGSHRDARRSKAVLEEAREGFAKALGVRSKRVLFTSGGTESANLGILGTQQTPGGAAIVSAIEHHAVLESAKRRPEVISAPVTPGGVIDLDRLKDLLIANFPKVDLVSVMAVNNETGVIQPLSEVSSLVRRHGGRATIFCDAVQAPPWMQMSEIIELCDVVGLSAHKFGGPRGVGIVVADPLVPLNPILFGGGQEYDLRSGTQSVPAIASAIAAYEECLADLDHDVDAQRHNAEIFVGLLRAAVPSVVVSGEASERVGGVVNLAFPGLSNEEILFLCDEGGLSISGGASCASGALEPSHVLVAMGATTRVAKSCVRISFGYRSTSTEARDAAKILVDAVQSLGYEGPQ